MAYNKLIILTVAGALLGALMLSILAQLLFSWGLNKPILTLGAIIGALIGFAIAKFFSELFEDTAL